MDRFNFWDVRKNSDYRFVDNTIREYFEVGGVSVFLHKYVGTINQDDLLDPSQPSANQSKTTGVREIQDLFFQENRDRSYDPYVYELKAIYNMMDTEFDIRQFGMFLEADSYYLSFHLNEIVEKIGRKLMPGDVLEMLHMRDDALLDTTAPAINKFYQITDVNRAASGWSITWRPHILRVKIKPLTDSQEFSQILNTPTSQQVGGDGLQGTVSPPGTSGSSGVIGSGDAGGTTDTNISDLISDFRSKMAVSQAIEQEAEHNVPYRNFEAGHLWIVPGTETGREHPWIFTGDGVPPNSSIPARSGTQLPTNANEGDYFLLIPGRNPEIDVDQGMPRLYRFTNGLWIFQEVDLRMKWQSAHRILESFLNNDNITTINGESFPEKQNLSKVMLPRADL